MDNKTCPICLENLTNDNYMIVCFNEHQYCKPCYDETIKPRTTSCPLGGGEIQLNTNCPECREPMFDWRLPTTPAPTTPAPRRIRARPRCSICRQEGHNRLTCNTEDGLIWRGLRQPRVPVLTQAYSQNIADQLAHDIFVEAQGWYQ